jgi:leader peptidase (prepilin peptidase)/N-methyltransferase
MELVRSASPEHREETPGPGIVGPARTTFIPLPAAREARFAVALIGGFAAIACLGRYGFGARGLISAFVAVVLVLISAIDIERRIIPNRIVLPAIAIVLVAQLAFYPDRALEWILAAVGAGLFFLIPILFYPSGMGLGDVKLAILLGATLGTAVMGALLIGLLAAAAFGIAILVRQGRAGRKTAIPFGPFLAFGALVALLFF